MRGEPGLGERLDLLESAGVVTADARSLTQQVLDEIEHEFDVHLDEEPGSQLATHLAMALSRLDRGEPETSALSVVDEELAECPRELEFSRKVLAQCGQQLGQPVPEGEVAYLAVHLCALTS